MESVKIDWEMPAPPAGEVCPECGKVITCPVAYDTGDGYELSWDCEDLCGEAAATGQDKFYIKWPFAGDGVGSSEDLQRLGFTLF